MDIEGVKIDYSKGYGKNGKIAAYIRPDKYCYNRSRKVTGFSVMELNEAIKKCAFKWFTPINYYTINGETVGSNSSKNALTEYWRVCERDLIGKIFEVNQLHPFPVGEDN